MMTPYVWLVLWCGPQLLDQCIYAAVYDVTECRMVVAELIDPVWMPNPAFRCVDSRTGVVLYEHPKPLER